MEDFIKQRTFEISFAVFRVAALVKNFRIREELENFAVDLLIGNTEVLPVLNSLIKLAEGISEIKPADAKVLYREIGNLESAVRQYSLQAIRQEQDEINQSGNRQSAEESEIEGIFSKPPMVVNPAKPAKQSGKSSNPANGNGNGSGNGNGNIINSAMRQTAILAKIRQLPDCRMKDLIAAFSEISERTLRNDLQRLYEQGMLERAGGGPLTFYRVKNADLMNLEPESFPPVTSA